MGEAFLEAVDSMAEAFLVAEAFLEVEALTEAASPVAVHTEADSAAAGIAKQPAGRGTTARVGLFRAP